MCGRCQRCLKPACARSEKSAPAATPTVPLAMLLATLAPVSKAKPLPVP